MGYRDCVLILLSFAYSFIYRLIKPNSFLWKFPEHYFWTNKFRCCNYWLGINKRNTRIRTGVLLSLFLRGSSPLYQLSYVSMCRLRENTKKKPEPTESYEYLSEHHWIRRSQSRFPASQGTRWTRWTTSGSWRNTAPRSILKRSQSGPSTPKAKCSWPF